MTLPILWFILIAVLWIGYLTLEGFDFGVGMLLKILGRDERERRAMLGTIGPHWDGNEVWLLTAGGATFAAFPEWYGTLFSGAYLVLLAILLCLIVRVCAIEWREKINDQPWRDRWDWVHTVAAWIPSILWGAAFANLVQGMRIEVIDTASGAPCPRARSPPIPWSTAPPTRSPADSSACSRPSRCWAVQSPACCSSPMERFSSP